MKPYRFYLMNNFTKEIKPFVSYRTAPIESDVFGYVETSTGIKEYKQIYTAYEDTRYKAKLRLYNYLRKKQGLSTYPPKYKPFEGTEIGKTIAILNF